MMVPKIEDGNNFGVGIQEDVLGEVGKSEADAGSYLEQLSRYDHNYGFSVTVTHFLCTYIVIELLYSLKSYI